MQAVTRESRHVVCDGALIGIAAWIGPVDAEPAVLVERNAHSVDIPLEHPLNRGVVCRTLEDLASLHAHVLSSRVAESLKDNGLALIIDELVAGNSDSPADCETKES